MRPLAQVSPTAAIGGKARQLARLSAAGLPVPPSAVVLPDDFARALRAAGLYERAEAVARGEADEGLCDAVRALSPTEAQRARWVRAARALGDRLAVRSSGLDEDGAEHSFAGQHETFLGVAPHEVPDKIVACWASLYAPRALAYRRGRGPAPGALAVLVQQQLAPESAGVMFTINPLNGSWREMVVEAVWGLGEGLVSGQITPHWFLVRRPRKGPAAVQRVAARVRLQVVQQDLPPLTHQVVAHDGRTRLEELPGPLRDRTTLPTPALKKLCRLGLRVEAALGEPVDIEWARGPDGAFVLLQARPITALGSPRPRSDVLYTRRFIGERWPEPATPMGWSILQPLLEWFIAYPDTQAAHLGGGPALRLVQGRPYINATVFRHLAFKLPGAPPPRFMLELVPPDEEAAWRRRHAVAPHLAVYASIFRTTFAERRWERFRYNPFTNHQHWDTFRDALQRHLPALSRPVTTTEQGIALVEEQIRWIRDYCSVHVCSLLFANIFYQLLESALSAWAPDKAASALPVLATCPPGNRTVATNRALASLAAVATQADLAALSAGEPPREAFATALRSFLAAYGHRSEASWEIMAPHWADDPRQLVPLLKVQQQRPAPPEPNHEATVADTLRALSEVVTPWQALLLRQLTWYTRRYLLLRENQRFWFDHLLAATRRTLLQLGDQLVADGRLPHRDDVAFLPWPIVRDVLRGQLEADDLAQRAASARAEWHAQRDADPPTFLVGDDAAPTAPAGHRRDGLGISGGRHRGRVRVLRRASDGHDLKPGDVLVTRAVDPGWTPLFATAGAVVLEMGSVLSHGAVVAREYGIPAVVNLDGITRQLADGDEVTVDGTRGVVWVHPGQALEQG
jgi:pyruvate,water dikinase